MKWRLLPAMVMFGRLDTGTQRTTNTCGRPGTGSATARATTTISRPGSNTITDGSCSAGVGARVITIVTASPTTLTVRPTIQLGAEHETSAAWGDRSGDPPASVTNQAGIL